MEELTDQELDTFQNDFQKVRDRAYSQIGEIEQTKKRSQSKGTKS
ncbi:MAG: hypothetical protein ACR2JB_28565 [Bryobacteraceae bacterium]